MNLTGWVMSVTAAIAVSALADIVIADGNTRKFVKSATALIVFAVLIAPIPALIKNADYTDSFVAEYVDDEYLYQSSVSKARFGAENLKKRLELLDIHDAEVSVHLTGHGSECEIAAAVIDISASGNVLATDAEIKAFAASYLNVDSNKVFITGRKYG